MSATTPIYTPTEKQIMTDKKKEKDSEHNLCSEFSYKSNLYVEIISRHLCIVIDACYKTLLVFKLELNVITNNNHIHRECASVYSNRNSG